MNKPFDPLDENKKRAAFKRFSQMSAAGLAVLSISAFTDVSAKQLPANVGNEVIKNQNCQLANLLSDTLSSVDDDSLKYTNSRDIPYDYSNNYGENNNYCNYYNHIDYNNSNNYSNAYSNNYSNNYSDNYSDSN